MGGGGERKGEGGGGGEGRDRENENRTREGRRRERRWGCGLLHVVIKQFNIPTTEPCDFSHIMSVVVGTLCSNIHGALHTLYYGSVDEYEE